MKKVTEIDRYACRQQVTDNFSVKQMTDSYEAIYKQILAEQFAQNGHLHTPVAFANSSS